MMYNTLCRRLAYRVGALLLATQCLNAQADLAVMPLLDPAADGNVAIGMALRYEQSPYLDQDSTVSQYSDYSVDVLPLYYYQGKYLSVSGTEAGITLLNTEHLTAKALMAYRFNRLENQSSGALKGLDEREQTLEGGVSVMLKGAWGSLEGRYLRDLQDNHDGSEWALRYQYLWQTGRWRIAPFVSLLGQDENFSDYYYGVDGHETSLLGAGLSPYQAEADTAWRAGLRTTYRWTDRFSVFANVSATVLSDSASESPIVDKEATAQFLAGMIYTMGNVKKLYIDEALNSNDERPLWSWRLNYGYTAQETFHKVHRGYIQRNRDLHTNLLGLTVGRLIDDGDKVDFWLKASVNRLLEEGHQPDTWEFNLYTMLMGTGYSPWTGRELFRYGFGVGMSYAQRVPAVEQFKQAQRGENDGQFLNYLEAQLDTPLSNLFGKRAWKNCYVGMTLVHRSGIFGSSDLLGNVSGGSDVLTAHLECKR